MFKFRPENRPITEAHVRYMANSIKVKNLMDRFPVIVNSNMELIDGQHRVKACERLGIPVKYTVDENISAEDMITLNVAKSWQIGDYLNYYVVKEDEHYVRLARWMKECDMTLKIAMALLGMNSRKAIQDFKEGNMIFTKAEDIEEFKLIKETIEIIKGCNGAQGYTHSSKFWKALMFLFKAPEFNKEHWMKNIKKMASRVESQITTRDYLKLFIGIFNYYAEVKIQIGKFLELQHKY